MIKQLSSQLQAVLFIIISFILISIIGPNFVVKVLLSTIALAMLDIGLKLLSLPSVMQCVQNGCDKFRQL